MPTDDREQQFERGLARHLRNASPDANCPDTETLAAYHERGLSLEEMARWKQHITGCVRCQETLALVEQSEDVRAEEWRDQNVPAPVLEEMAGPAATRASGVVRRPEEPSLGATLVAQPAAALRSARPRPPLRWVIPIGALAAGVIVWIGVREIQMQHRNEAQSVQMAKNQQAAPQISAPAYEPRELVKKEAPPARAMDHATAPQKSGAVPAAKTPSRVESPAPQGVPAPPSPATESALTIQRDQGIVSAERLISPKAAATASPEIARSREAERAAQPSVASGAAGGVAANTPAPELKKAPMAAMTQAVTVEAQTTPLNATSGELTMNMKGATNLLQMAAADRRFIVAPGEKYAWHVGDAGKIDRSTDHGKTWKPQKSGVTADLTAGSATSDKICWVVGKAGTLLLSTDGGKHWKQIVSPISEDLGGIHATDAMRVTIWDVPNRNSFETSDGGATWNRIANE